MSGVENRNMNTTFTVIQTKLHDFQVSVKRFFTLSTSLYSGQYIAGEIMTYSEQSDYWN